MSKQDEIYTFWTKNTGLTREVAIQQVMEKFEVAYETARTYYLKWRKEFLKPKFSPAGQPQQIIEKEYKKPMETEKKENSEPALNVLKTNQEEIETITEEKAESEAIISKVENIEVSEPAVSENSASRLEVTRIVRAEGKYIEYDSDSDSEGNNLAIGRADYTAYFKKSELDDLIAELTELREVLKK